MSFSERYSRHISLPGFGIEAQNRLSSASVLVVGAGGLGCPVLQYLVAAGIGKIGIVDGDRVSLSNLQRQILYNVNDVGFPKSTIAKQKLNLLNPSIAIESFSFFLDDENVHEIFPLYDLIIDASDNFECRYLINDASVFYNKPFIYGSIHHYQGQVSVFNFQGGPTYDQLFPEPPSENLNCNAEGVLGVLPGIIGAFQASEAIKVITGVGECLSGKLLIYDMLKNVQDILTLPEYPSRKKIAEIKSRVFKCLNEISDIEKADSDLIIDVRDAWEIDGESQTLNIPFDEIIQTDIRKLNKKKILLICNSGKRSKAAAMHLQEKYPELIFASGSI